MVTALLLALPSCAEHHRLADGGVEDVGLADGGSTDTGSADTGALDTAVEPMDIGPRPDAGDLDCGIHAAEVHYIGANLDPVPIVDLVVGEGVYCWRVGVLASQAEAAEMSELPWVQCEVSNVGAADYLCRETATLSASGNPLLITQDIVDGLCWLTAVAPHSATPACIRPTF
ncbi:MAG: hypothetical protein R3B40_14335 [Polyangiales bacterium]|nr:hypothetical protein [Sandaracinaceae bacterium]